MQLVRVARRGGDINKILQQGEDLYVHTRHTLTPKGLNMEFDLKLFFFFLSCFFGCFSDYICV